MTFLLGAGFRQTRPVLRRGAEIAGASTRRQTPEGVFRGNSFRICNRSPGRRAASVDVFFQCLIEKIEMEDRARRILVAGAEIETRVIGCYLWRKRDAILELVRPSS